MAFWHLSSPPECWSQEENSPMVNLTFPNKLEGRLASHGRYECEQRHQYLVMTNAAASIINSIILLSHTSAFWCEQCTGEFNSIQSDHSSHLLNYHGMQRLTALHFNDLIPLHWNPIACAVLQEQSSTAAVRFVRCLRNDFPLCEKQK